MESRLRIRYLQIKVRKLEYDIHIIGEISVPFDIDDSSK
jgi:hypothetical protein